MLSQEERDYQEEVRKLQNVDLRCMKLPNRISQIAACVPMACNPMPDDALPRWLDLPLDHKLPLIPCSEGQFRLSRNRIGKSLFGCSTCREFDINDPYIRRTPIKYEPLHDPNLKPYYKKNPRALKELEIQGFLNENGKVDCSISDFNKYRDYLSRTHNKCVNNERERQDRITEAGKQQLKKIKQYLNKEDNLRKTENARTRREENRASRNMRKVMEEIKEMMEHPCGTYQQRLAINRAFLAEKREFLKAQRAARIEHMQRAELENNRKLVLDWYCRDLYDHKLKLARKEHRKKLRKNELDGFIKCKREFQEQKVRYDKAILARYKIERHRAVLKRNDHYTDLEVHRKANLKRRAEEAQKKSDRELYLMRKYGRKWLAFVAAKKHEVSVFHDSLWHIRQQLREMVGVLRAESGTVSFTSFIQGLVKLKPGKNTIEMSDETREVISFVISCLLNRAYKEYIRKSTSCALDFFTEEDRKKMGRLQCPNRGIIPIEDFIPPANRRCLRPPIPFEKPCGPCTGPCADRHRPETDQEWQQRCHEMADCLTEINNALPKKPKSCFDELLQEMLKEQRKELQRRTDAFEKKKNKGLRCKSAERKALELKAVEEKAKGKKKKFDCGSICTNPVDVDELVAKANASYASVIAAKITALVEKRKSEFSGPKKRTVGTRIPYDGTSPPPTSEHNLGQVFEVTDQPDQGTIDPKISGPSKGPATELKLGEAFEIPDKPGQKALSSKTPFDDSPKHPSSQHKLGEGSEVSDGLNKETLDGSVQSPVDQPNERTLSSNVLVDSTSQDSPTEEIKPADNLEGSNLPDKSSLDSKVPTDRSSPGPTDERKLGGAVEVSDDKPTLAASSSDPTEALKKVSDDKPSQALPDSKIPTKMGSSSGPADERKLGEALKKVSDDKPIQDGTKSGPTEERKLGGAVEVSDDKPAKALPDSKIPHDGSSDFSEPRPNEKSRGSKPPDGSLNHGPASKLKLSKSIEDSSEPDQKATGSSQRPRSKHSLGETSVEQWEKRCSEMAQCISDVHTAMSMHPDPSSEDESFVEKIIKEQLTKLQSERDICRDGDECAIDDIADDENMSRLSSVLVDKTICKQVHSLDPCINESALDLGTEIGTADEAAISAVADDEAISRISSVIVKKAICEQMRLLDPCADTPPVSRDPSPDSSYIDLDKEDKLYSWPENYSTSKSPTSDVAFVDSIIDDQMKQLQHEKDIIAGGDDTAIDALANDGNLSRVASGIVNKAICTQIKLLDPCYEQSSLGYAPVERNRDTRQDQIAGPKGESTYLDPNEEGISPVRSEIRSSLNLVRQELEEMKRQLTSQGIYRPPPPTNPEP